ncbi:MAG: hypothetical protein Q8M37_00060 [Nevskia sp.]|nr:hypothetical protein [Nevskia sp.]
MAAASSILASAANAGSAAVVTRTSVSTMVPVLSEHSMSNSLPSACWISNSQTRPLVSLFSVACSSWPGA